MYSNIWPHIWPTQSCSRINWVLPSTSVLLKLLHSDVGVKDLKCLSLTVLHIQHVELMMDGNEWQVMRIFFFFFLVTVCMYCTWCQSFIVTFSTNRGVFLKAKYVSWFEIRKRVQEACEIWSLHVSQCGGIGGLAKLFPPQLSKLKFNWGDCNFAT